MDYDELVDDIVKRVHDSYKYHVEYQGSENLDVEPFEEVAEQLLNDELNDSLIYYWQMWVIIKHTCDNDGLLFQTGTATFNGTTPYAAFWNDCFNKLNIG